MSTDKLPTLRPEISPPADPTTNHPTVAEIPAEIPDTDFLRPMKIGLAVIGVALGGFSLWASFAPLDSAVVTQGMVTVETKRKIVQHLEGGIVDQILVQEGQPVTAGTALVRLKGTAAHTHMASIAQQYDAKLAEQARLKAERDGVSVLTFPKALEDRAKDKAVAEIMNREKDRFEQRSKTLAGQREILMSRITQLESQREGRSMLEKSKREQLVLLQAEIEGLRGLAKRGFYPVNKLRAQERELARMQGEMMSDGAGANQTDKEIGETRLEIMQVEQKFRDDLAAELTKVETELHDLAQRLAQATDSVERLVVVAPVDGIIQNLKIAGTGAVVAAGGEMMELVPNNDRLIVEAQVNSRDINRVHAGQDAQLRFTSFETRVTPVIEGEVQVVSADATTDPETRQSYYIARVRVTEDQAQRLPKNMKAGMPVEVMLEGGSRTPLQYLLKPLKDGFARSMTEI